MHGNPENAWEFPLFFTIKNVKYLTDFIKRKAYLIFLNHLGIMGKRHSKYWFRIPELFLKLFRESWIFGIGIFRIQDYWNFRDWDVRVQDFRTSEFCGIPGFSGMTHVFKIRIVGADWLGYCVLKQNIEMPRMRPGIRLEMFGFRQKSFIFCTPLLKTWQPVSPYPGDFSDPIH